jgi:DnaJ-domain-containing protein 1
MFLNSLNPTEKDNFMKLAMVMIKADGIVEDSEKQIMSAYANEMQITVRDFDEHDEIDRAIEEFAMNSTAQTKRIVFLELLALAFADGDHAAEEKALMRRLADTFGLDREFIEQAINLEDAYLTVYSSLVNLIEKGE